MILLLFRDLKSKMVAASADTWKKRWQTIEERL